MWDQVESRVLELAGEGLWEDLVTFCEEYELEIGGYVHSDQLPLYTVQLFGYLIQNDLDAARYLWKRISPEVKSKDASTAALHGMIRGAVRGDHCSVYRAVQSHAWDALHGALARKFLVSYRYRMLSVIERSYSTICLATVVEWLGLEPQRATEFLTELRWKFDGNFFQVEKPASSAMEDIDFKSLELLTSYAVYLES